MAQYFGLQMEPGGNGGLLWSNVEGTAGMSGGPMLWLRDRLLGVAVGSPCPCEDGSVLDVNWGAALTTRTLERIRGVLDAENPLIGLPPGGDMSVNYYFFRGPNCR